MSVRGVNKVSIIGAGAVGSSLAYASLIRGVARHVVLHDINAAKVRAEALDLAHGSQFMPQAKIEGSEDPEVTRGSRCGRDYPQAPSKNQGSPGWTSRPPP